MTIRPLRLALIGAGDRGTFTFGATALAHPNRLRFVAVAEPDPQRRARFAAAHGLTARACFSSWEELLSAPLGADAVLCATPDREHVAPAVAALERGYHVLLEKPMATTPEDCLRIVQTQERSGRLLGICHVLRYAPFFAALHEIIRSGRLGRIVMAEQRENVAFWHMAHSYVRGNWRNRALSSPMILAKCCHDLDILTWMMEGNPVESLHSFGSLLHFRPDQAPAGATERCTDGCPAAGTCPFYAPRLYLTENTGWPTETISVDLSYEARLWALQSGPYGRCVYRCDNDVVDHQVVTMKHMDGAVSTLIMQGHSGEEERTMRYDGTRATVRGRFVTSGPSEIEIQDHLTGEIETIAVPPSEDGGHGGGDARLLLAFAAAVRGEGEDLPTSARASLQSHLLAFAAERSRQSGSTTTMATYLAELETANGDHRVL